MSLIRYLIRYVPVPNSGACSLPGGLPLSQPARFSNLSLIEGAGVVGEAAEARAFATDHQDKCDAQQHKAQDAFADELDVFHLGPSPGP